jgi:hypothetical protein
MMDMDLDGREKLGRYIDKSLNVVVETPALGRRQVRQRHVRE